MRLGRPFTRFTGKTPDIIAGIYAVSAHETAISELTLTAAPADIEVSSCCVTEVTASADRRIYDGVLVFTGSSRLAILKDRLMHTARIHGLHHRSAERSFHGIVYDNGPLEAAASVSNVPSVSCTRASTMAPAQYR